MSEVDKLLNRYAKPHGAPAAAQTAPTASLAAELAGAGPEATADGELSDAVACWAWLRGMKERAVMLELRKRDGRVRSVSYGWMDHCDFDPSGKITLHVGGGEIAISGRNLDLQVRPNLRLYSAICRHRALWVRESDQREVHSSGAKDMVVESISW